MLRIAMLSYHTCPLATLGGKDTGGMNVYVRELDASSWGTWAFMWMCSRARRMTMCRMCCTILGMAIVWCMCQPGPETPSQRARLANYIPEFVEGIKQFAAEKGITYDVIHSHYWMSGLAAEALSDAWGGTPIVHMFHTLGEMKNRVARSER